MSGFTLPVGDGLVLRLLEPRHAAELFAVTVVNREHVGRWLPWPWHTNSVEDSRAFAQQSLSDFAEQRGLALSIVADGSIVGGIGWTDWKNSDEGGVRMASADTGYWVASDQEGKGIVTRSVVRLTEFGFETHDLHRLTIRAEPDNERSWRVAERAGYTREGTLRGVCFFDGKWIDHHLYARLNPAH